MLFSSSIRRRNGFGHQPFAIFLFERNPLLQAPAMLSAAEYRRRNIAPANKNRRVAVDRNWHILVPRGETPLCSAAFPSYGPAQNGRPTQRPALLRPCESWRRTSSGIAPESVPCLSLDAPFFIPSVKRPGVMQSAFRIRRRPGNASPRTARPVRTVAPGHASGRTSEIAYCLPYSVTSVDAASSVCVL